MLVEQGDDRVLQVRARGKSRAENPMRIHYPSAGSSAVNCGDESLAAHLRIGIFEEYRFKR
jgi:hypothetical protein